MLWSHLQKLWYVDGAASPLLELELVDGDGPLEVVVLVEGVAGNADGDGPLEVVVEGVVACDAAAGLEVVLACDAAA